MKTGTLRDCAHSQNAKAAAPSMNCPCQLEVISSPLNPSEPRHRSPSAMWTPVAVRARDDGSGVVVDELHDVDRGLSRNRGYHLRSERIADHSSSNAGLGADILLQLEIGHVVIGDGRQATIIRHRVFADRYAPQRLGDAKRIITGTRCTVGMDVDDGH